MVNRHKRALLVNKSHNANARTRADDFMREKHCKQIKYKMHCKFFYTVTILYCKNAVQILKRKKKIVSGQE